MLSILILAMISTSIFSTEAQKQFNSTILSQQIIYYENDYLSVEIIDEDDDSVIFMNVNKAIREEDDIQLQLRLKRPDESDLISFVEEMNLCALIRNEVKHPNDIQAKYRMSQAFNLYGLECPVGKRSVKLTPWMMPNKHIFETDMECGTWHYELTLQQCVPFLGCTPLIVADSEVIMTADNCYIQDGIRV